MPLRKSSFGQLSKGPLIIIGIVVVVIVFGLFMIMSKKSPPIETTESPIETTESPIETTASPIQITTASPIQITTASPIQITTASSPVSILPSTSGKFYIQNKDTGMYLLPYSKTKPNFASLSNTRDPAPFILTASGNTYTITLNNLSLVAYGDLGGGKNIPGLYTDITSIANPLVVNWNITQIGPDTVTIQNVGKQSVGGVSWLASVNNEPNLVISSDSPSTTWTLIPG